jgi:hypothetical protein
MHQPRHHEFNSHLAHGNLQWVQKRTKKNLNMVLRMSCHASEAPLSSRSVIVRDQTDHATANNPCRLFAVFAPRAINSHTIRTSNLSRLYCRTQQNKSQKTNYRTFGGKRSKADWSGEGGYKVQGRIYDDRHNEWTTAVQPLQNDRLIQSETRRRTVFPPKDQPH